MSSYPKKIAGSSVRVIDRSIKDIYELTGVIVALRPTISDGFEYKIKLSNGKHVWIPRESVSITRYAKL